MTTSDDTRRPCSYSNKSTPYLCDLSCNGLPGDNCHKGMTAGVRMLTGKYTDTGYPEVISSRFS